MIDSWIWGKTLRPRAHYFSGFAASMAFYLVLSITPFLMIAFGAFLRLLPMDLSEQMKDILSDVIPAGTILKPEALIETAFRASGGGALTVTFLFALWSCSNFTMQVVNGVTYIFTAADPEDPKGWMNRLRAFVLVFLWALVVVFVAAIMVMGPVAGELLAKFDWMSGLGTMIFNLGRTLVGFVVLMFMFVITYRVAAGRKRFRKLYLWEAAFLASLGWHALGFLYTKFLGGLWKSSLVYGALGGVVATLLWAFFSAWVLILGACYVVRREELTATKDS